MGTKELKTGDDTGTLVELEAEVERLRRDVTSWFRKSVRLDEECNTWANRLQEAHEERDKWRRRARTWKAFAKIVYEERLESVRWDPYA